MTGALSALLLFLVLASAEASGKMFMKREFDDSSEEDPNETEAERKNPVPEDFSAQGVFGINTEQDPLPIDHHDGVIDSNIMSGNQDEVYDMTGHEFHILSRHENTPEAIAERNLNEVNRVSESHHNYDD